MLQIEYSVADVQTIAVFQTVGTKGGPAEVRRKESGLDRMSMSVERKEDGGVEIWEDWCVDLIGHMTAAVTASMIPAPVSTLSRWGLLKR